MILRIALAVAAGLLWARDAWSQTADEYRVKAALIYDFAKFVQWPCDILRPDDSLSICVLGRNPLNGALAQTMAGKSIEGRPLCFRQISDLKQAASCRVLFLGDRNRRGLPAILDAVRGRGVLTVGDGAGFAAQGGVVNFVPDRGRIHFQINLAAAEEQKLTISSKLLGLAEIVCK
jgi:YfiR/HmsC-like